MSPEHPGNLSYGPSFDKEHPNLDLPLSRLGSNLLSMGFSLNLDQTPTNTTSGLGMLLAYCKHKLIGLVLGHYQPSAFSQYKVKEVLPDKYFVGQVPDR